MADRAGPDAVHLGAAGAPSTSPLTGTPGAAPPGTPSVAPPGTPTAPPAATRYADRGDGWTLAMELLTATFVWGGIGWLGDRALGTAPLLMAIGFVLGNGLGIYLIWVRSQDRFVQEHSELMARRRRGPGGSPVTSSSGHAPTARHDVDSDAPSPVARPVGGRPAAGGDGGDATDGETVPLYKADHRG